VRLLLGFNGPPACGKDTAADHLVAEHGFTRIAFADPIRLAALGLDPFVGPGVRLSEIVGAYGWEQTKRDWPEVRRILQALGTEAGRHIHGPHVWISHAFDKIDSLPPDLPVVITDVRFGNEAAALRRCHGTLIHLRRSGTTSDHVVMAHPSETESAAITADISIPNNGTLDDLHRRLDRLVYRLSKRSFPL
jgi:dephospho-CoA kinase